MSLSAAFRRALCGEPQPRRCADHTSRPADQAPLQPWLSYFGVIFLGLVVIFNGFEVFLTDSWSTSDFISAYVSTVTVPLAANAR